MNLAGAATTISVVLMAKDMLTDKLAGVNRELTQIEKASQTFAKIGATLGGASLATQGVSQGAQNMLQGFVRTAATVDDLKAKLRSMPDVSADLANQFERRARDWAKSHANSVEEYMETVYQMVSAGLTAPEQALAATETAMRVAKGTMGDAVQTANTVAVAFNNMGDKTKPAADEIARLGDVLTRTQQQFQISNMGQLAEGLKYATPAAKAARMEITELAAVVGQLNTAGLQGSQAGTAFAASMRQIFKAQEQLGYQIVRNKDGTLNFIETLRSVTSQFGDFNKLTDAESKKLQKAFGDEGARAIVLLGQNLDVLEQAYARVADSAGAAAAAQADMESGVGQQWAVLVNNLRELSLEMGNALLPTLREIVPHIRDMFQAVSSFAQKYPEGIAVALGLVGLAAVAAPVLAAGAALATLTSAVLSIAASGAAVAALGALAGALGNFAAVAAVGTASFAFGTWVADQIDIIVQKLTDNKNVSLGDWLYDNQQEGKERAERWKQTIIGTVDAIVQWFADVPAKLSAQFDAWKEAGTLLVQRLRDGITEGLKGALGIGAKIREAVVAMRNMARDWIKVGEDIVAGIIQGIKAKAQAMWSEVKELGAGALRAIKESLGIRSPSREFMAVGRDIGAGLVIGIQGSESAVRAAVAKLGESAIYAGDESTLRMIRDQEAAIADLTAGLDKAGQAVDTVANKIKKSYRDNKGRFLPEDEAERASVQWQRAADDINRSLTDALFRAFEDGKSFGRALKDTLINAFKTMILRPTIQAIIKPVGGAIAGALGGSSAAMAGEGSASSLQSVSTLSSLNNLFQGTFGNSAFMASEAVGNYLASSTNTALKEAGMSLLNGGSSAIAAGASYLGAAAVGMFVGNMISGGYSAIGKNGNTAVTAGTVIGAVIGGPIGAAIGGTIGGVVNRLFGRKLKDTGIQGTFGAGGFDGQNYEFYKGGVFRSDKTKTSAIDPALDRAFDQQFAALKFGVASMAKTLGLGTQSIDAFTASVKLSFKGLTDEQIGKKIEETFTDLGNQLAAGLGQGLSDFTRDGETALETLTRLSTSLISVNSVLDTLNLSLFDVSLAGSDLASQLADVFGGLENLSNATGTYYERFYSEQERLAKLTEQTTLALGNLGYALPTGKDGFRALVDALDLTTAAGQQTFAALMGLAPAFAEIAEAAEESAAALARAAEESAAALARAAEESRRAALDAVDAAYRVLDTAIRRQIDSINAARQAELDTLDARAEPLRELVSLADSLGRSLTSAIDRLRGANSGAMTLDAARRDIDAMLAAAFRGEMPDQDRLDRALGTVTSDQPGNYASRTEWQRAQLAQAAKLETLAQLSEREGNIARQQLDAIERQRKTVEDSARAQIDALDRQLENARLQLDTLRGIDTRILSVEQALREFASAVQGAWAAQVAQAAQVAPTIPSYATQPYSVNDTPAMRSVKVETQTGVKVSASDPAIVQAAKVLYQSINGGASTLEYNAAAAAVGGNIAAAVGWDGSREGAERLRQIYGFAKGGYYPGGLALVGEEGPEIINFSQPGQVYTAAQTRNLIGTGGQAMVDELRALRAEVAAMRHETAATARHTAKTAKAIDRAMPDGDALAVRTAA